jgi:hypothetical protein
MQSDLSQCRFELSARYVKLSPGGAVMITIETFVHILDLAGTMKGVGDFRKRGRCNVTTSGTFNGMRIPVGIADGE